MYQTYRVDAVYSQISKEEALAMWVLVRGPRGPGQRIAS